MQHDTLVPVRGKTTTTPTTTEAGSIAYPITLESFTVDGTNWKKVYSDGWIEMGGYVAPASLAAYADVAVTFNWSFTSACITIECQPVATATGSNDVGLYGVRDVSTTGFTYQRGGANSYTTGFYWIAKGI